MVRSCVIGRPALELLRSLNLEERGEGETRQGARPSEDKESPQASPSATPQRDPPALRQGPASSRQ